VRSFGSGSHNAHKEATAVEIRFDIPASSLPPEVKERLTRAAGRHVTTEGVLVDVSRAFRSQVENRNAVRERLAEQLRLAAEEPRTRKRTRPRAKARSARLATKRAKGALKASRHGRDEK
jgi:ribosome-associated protein